MPARGAVDAAYPGIDAERASLRASQDKEDHLRLVIDTIPTMAWSLTDDGKVDFVNQRWLDYTGLDREAAIAGANEIVHPEDLPRVIAMWMKDSAVGQTSEYQMRLRRADGQYRWFLVRTVPLTNAHGRILKWYGASTDIEDRVRAEDALKEAALQLQAMSRRLVQVQESERRKLARELHDRVGQSLTALNLNLAIISHALPVSESAIRSRLDDSSALLESSMETIGNVLADLRPPLLDDLGLRAALEWYVMQFAARSGITASLSAEGAVERPDLEVEVALFRIAQEALNNVTKHAQAGSIEIVLSSSPSAFEMTVTDDGVGLGALIGGLPRIGSGLGMVTMKERAQAVGGQVTIESLQHRGTKLTVSVQKIGKPIL